MTDSSEWWRSVEELFADALELPPEERDAYVRRKCSDPRKLAVVLRMLNDERKAARVFGEGESMLNPGVVIVEAARRYTIGRLIGRGGMGDVYEARQDMPSRNVAVKVLRTRFAAELFEAEVDALRRLSHPGIVHVYGAGQWAGRYWLAMELVPGARPIAASVDGLEPARRIKMICEVCDALAHAHKRGVIHHDLTPNNILVDADGRIRVVDFGIAQVATASAAASQRFGVAGVSPYIAPERLHNGDDEPDSRSDIYSLGVVLYELLGGCLPYASNSAAAADITERAVVPLRVVNRKIKIKKDLDYVVMKALERDPADRYASAGELSDALRRYMQHLPVRVAPVHTAVLLVRRHPFRVAAACLGVMALVLALTLVDNHASHRAYEAGIRYGKGRDEWRSGSLFAGYLNLREALNRMPSGPGHDAQTLDLAAATLDLGAPALALQLLDEELSSAPQLDIGRRANRLAALALALDGRAAGAAERMRRSRFGRSQAHERTFEALVARATLGVPGARNPAHHVGLSDVDRDGRDELVVLEELGSSIGLGIHEWTGERFELVSHSEVRAPASTDPTRPLEAHLVVVPLSGDLLLHFGLRCEGEDLRNTSWSLMPLRFDERHLRIESPLIEVPAVRITASARAEFLGASRGELLAFAFWHPTREVRFFEVDDLAPVAEVTLGGISDPYGLAVIEDEAAGAFVLAIAEGHPQGFGISRHAWLNDRWSKLGHQHVGRIGGGIAMTSTEPSTALIALKDPAWGRPASRPLDQSVGQGLVTMTWEGGDNNTIAPAWRPLASEPRSPLGGVCIKDARVCGIRDGLALAIFTIGLSPNDPRSAGSVWLASQEGGCALGYAREACAGEIDGDAEPEVLLLDSQGNWSLCGAGPEGASGEPAVPTGWGMLLGQWERARRLRKTESWRDAAMATVRSGLPGEALFGLEAAAELRLVEQANEDIASMIDDLALLTFARSELRAPAAARGILAPDCRTALRAFRREQGSEVDAIPFLSAESGSTSPPRPNAAPWSLSGFEAEEAAWVSDPIGLDAQPRSDWRYRLAFSYARGARARSIAVPSLDPARPFRLIVEMVSSRLDYAMEIAFLLRPSAWERDCVVGFALTHDRMEHTHGDTWGIATRLPADCRDAFSERQEMGPAGGDAIRIELIWLPDSSMSIVRVRRRDASESEPDLVAVHSNWRSLPKLPSGPCSFVIESEAERDGPIRGAEPRAEFFIERVELERLP